MLRQECYSQKILKRELLSFSDFKETKNLGKYLGVTLIGKTLRHNFFAYPLENIKAKLTSYKVKHMSFASRVTLVKYALEAMPTYTIMSIVIPKQSLKEIQALHRNFIWGDTKSDKHIHVVNWRTITNPKMMGDLGPRNLVVTNRASL